jgi:hypothetical protein
MKKLYKETMTVLALTFVGLLVVTIISFISALMGWPKDVEIWHNILRVL